MVIVNVPSDLKVLRRINKSHQQKWLNLAKPGKAWEKCAILVRLARPCKAWAESLHLYQIWPECATPMLGLSRK